MEDPVWRKPENSIWIAINVTIEAFPRSLWPIDCCIGVNCKHSGKLQYADQDCNTVGRLQEHYRKTTKKEKSRRRLQEYYMARPEEIGWKLR